MPAGVRGFISFHIEQSEIFHNVRQNIISHFAKQNISLYAFVTTNVVLRKAELRTTTRLSFFDQAIKVTQAEPSPVGEGGPR